MKFTSLIFLIILLLFSLESEAQEFIETNGLYLPSKGKINVLFIFAQFPDDNLDVKNSKWQKNKPPKNMESWVEEKWTDTPTPGNITHYFNEMSFNKLKFTGKSLFIVAPHSRKWYLDNKKTRGFIHREVIEAANKKINFAQFDNWTLLGPKKHINKPDGIVEMIFMVWRNIAYDYPKDSVAIIQRKLDFNNDQGDIGGRSFNVDRGKRTVKTGWGISGNKPAGSGVTIRDYIETNALRTCIHEFAHYLLGNNSYHSGYGFWGMLDSWGKKNQCANSYERSMLGWINLKKINNKSSKTYKNLKLRDYVTTGDAIRITIDSAKNQYFYIENHQKLSYWENHHTFGNLGNGVYVLRQDALYANTLQIIPASGRYNWEVNQVVKNPWGEGTLPVYRQVQADRNNGYHDLQFIPWEWKKVKKSGSIHFTENKQTARPVEDVRYKGTGKEAFNIGYNEIFSPWSNPNSQDKNKNETGIGFKLNNLKNNTASLNIYINTASEAPPSKPINLEAKRISNGKIKLTWTQNIEPDINDGFYKIYKSEEGPVKPKSYSLEGKINANDKSGKAVTEWTDSKNNSGKKIFYRITVVDNSGLESLPCEYESNK